MADSLSSDGGMVLINDRLFIRAILPIVVSRDGRAVRTMLTPEWDRPMRPSPVGDGPMP